MTDIGANIESVKRKVEAAAGRAGRDPERITVVAVTKTHPPDVVRRAYDLGLRDFGENRVFEALDKQSQLKDLHEIRWHMIGHIQSRKANEVPANFQLVHSVDRGKIARHLNKHAKEAQITLPVLLECNVSGEQSKYGWELSDRETWEQAAREFSELIALENLDIRGLMTMAPWTADEQVIRTTFARLRSLRDYLQEDLGVAWQELSMGMTDDFEIAVEEGATLLRIGRAIFGPREG